MRARKSGSVTMLAYLSTGFMYCKVATFILWFNADPRYGLVYSVLLICKSAQFIFEIYSIIINKHLQSVQAILIPEPSYSGPEKIVYFNATSLDEELNRNKQVVWVVTFYAIWNPSCVNFASIFSKLSAEYV